eukprot:GHVR01111168.1.p1 GENE.GHVR01111168.1~~GHVR01111168.1.p1  ORF type:complete len:778 (+),score=66.47 GHVR01111168.1:858-3191(+)
MFLCIHAGPILVLSYFIFFNFFCYEVFLYHHIPPHTVIYVCLVPMRLTCVCCVCRQYPALLQEWPRLVTLTKLCMIFIVMKSYSVGVTVRTLLCVCMCVWTTQLFAWTRNCVKTKVCACIFSVLLTTLTPVALAAPYGISLAESLFVASMEVFFLVMTVAHATCLSRTGVQNSLDYYETDSCGSGYHTHTDRHSHSSGMQADTHTREAPLAEGECVEHSKVNFLNVKWRRILLSLNIHLSVYVTLALLFCTAFVVASVWISMQAEVFQLARERECLLALPIDVQLKDVHAFNSNNRVGYNNNLKKIIAFSFRMGADVGAVPRELSLANVDASVQPTLNITGEASSGEPLVSVVEDVLHLQRRPLRYGSRSTIIKKKTDIETAREFIIKGKEYLTTLVLGRDYAVNATATQNNPLAGSQNAQQQQRRRLLVHTQSQIHRDENQSHTLKQLHLLVRHAMEGKDPEQLTHCLSFFHSGLDDTVTHCSSFKVAVFLLCLIVVVIILTSAFNTRSSDELNGNTSNYPSKETVTNTVHSLSHKRVHTLPEFPRKYDAYSDDHPEIVWSDCSKIRNNSLFFSGVMSGRQCTNHSESHPLSRTFDCRMYTSCSPKLQFVNQTSKPAVVVSLTRDVDACDTLDSFSLRSKCFDLEDFSEDNMFSFERMILQSAHGKQFSDDAVSAVEGSIPVELSNPLRSIPYAWCWFLVCVILIFLSFAVFCFQVIDYRETFRVIGRIHSIVLMADGQLRAVSAQNPQHSTLDSILSKVEFFQHSAISLSNVRRR